MSSQRLLKSPPVDHYNFLDHGKLKHPDKVVKFLDLKKKDVAKFSDIAESSIRYDLKIPKAAEERLFEVAILINLVWGFFKDEDKTTLWFNISNPMLGYISPRDMIRMGQTKKLHKFIVNSLNSNKKK